MRWPNQEPKYRIGEAIYEPHRPMKYGIVLETFHSSEERFSGRPFYVVRWKDGTEETRWELDLKSLEALYADHQKKAATHLENIGKAKAL